MALNLRKRHEKRKGIDFKGLREVIKQGGWGYAPKDKKDKVAVLTYKLGQIDHQIRYVKKGLTNQGCQKLALKCLENLAEELEKSDLKKFQKQKFAGSIQRRAYRISNDPYVAKHPELDERAVELVEKMEDAYGVKPHHALERSASVIATIAGLVGGIFFLSSNITGNAIADLSSNTTSWVGGILLVVGLVAGFFWIKSKKKEPVSKSKKK